MIVNPGDGPSVVFISQIGTAGSSWQPVIDRMTSGATTVTYDRPGTGSAPPRTSPNQPLPYSAFADELAALLDENGVTGPLVVVGHSVGSLIARVFMSRHPARTAGIVHVDGSIPRLSLWPANTDPQGPDGDGPDATHFDLLAGEVEALDAVPAHPNMPAAVITRTPGRWIAGYLAELVDPLWTAYQRQLARLHGVPLLVATDAGHQVPREAPALVAYVVDQVVAAVRAETMDAMQDDGLEAAGGAVFDAEPPHGPASLNPRRRRPRPFVRFSDYQPD